MVPQVLELLVKVSFQGWLRTVVPSPQPDVWVLLKLSPSQKEHVCNRACVQQTLFSLFFPCDTSWSVPMGFNLHSLSSKNWL